MSLSKEGIWVRLEKRQAPGVRQAHHEGYWSAAPVAKRHPPQEEGSQHQPAVMNALFFGNCAKTEAGTPKFAAKSSGGLPASQAVAEISW